MHRYFVRLGVFAEIQIAEGGPALQRGTRVVLRSRRGVELGEIVSSLAASTASSTAEGSSSIRILRVVGDQDAMLLARLERHKRTAIEKCRRGLALRQSSATLLDIDHLFDGSSIVLHFLGNVDAETEAFVRELAADYESIVRTGPLAKLLSEGCGEGCGTTAAKGCSGCSGCAVAEACSSKPSSTS